MSRDAIPPPTTSPPPPAAPPGLPDDPAVLKQMIADLLRDLRCERRDREALQRRLDALLRHRAAVAAAAQPDQPLLFAEEAAPPVPPPPAPAEPAPPSRRGQCAPHGRRPLPAHLRREVRRHELSAAERACPGCGAERAEIGVDESEQLDYQPAQVFVVVHQRVKYACRCCQEHVSVAPKPAAAAPIARGLPGPGLLAQVIADKYLDHLPLHRTEQRFARLGCHLPRSTLGDWMAAAAALLTPLWQRLKRHVLLSKVLHTDDTTVRVRDESQSTQRFGRLWDYIGDADHPGVVFDYTPTHARDGPAAFLQDYRGYLQADAYGAYDGIYAGSDGTIIEVACWAHARNKFKDALSSDPERARAALAWVRQLYDVEDAATLAITHAELAGAAAAELRRQHRQERAVPLLTSLCQWLTTQRAQVLPKSPIATALGYALNQWTALNRYVSDGDLHIDNNVSERTLKLVGIGRTNWLFVGSDAGGTTAAVLYSFTATCKQLGIDSYAYLRDVLARLPDHPPEQLADLLPHRWRPPPPAAPTP